MEHWASFAVMNLAIILSMHIIQDKKINLKNWKMYLLYFVSLFSFIVIYELASPIFRVFFNTLVYIMEAKCLFRLNIKESFILGLVITLLNIFSEIVFAFLGFPIISEKLFSEQNFYFVLFNNFIIGAISVGVSYVIKRKQWYLSLLQNLPKITEKRIVVFSLLIVIIFNFLGLILHLISIEFFDNPSLFLISSSLSIFSSILVFIYLKTSNSYKTVTEKYDLTMNIVRDYEQIIENNKINNHETRNQFRILRNMTTNRKIIDYIDGILNDTINDSEELLMEVNKIPSGGLKGLIYAKLLCMKESNINYELYVDKKINIRKMNSISAELMVDICKIIGVFLDNAIEAVNSLKEKNITIELYTEKNDIVISVTNNFLGVLDTANFAKSGYTTKSIGHGYGLKLVSEILNRNRLLENYKEIYADNFTQNLKIKM